MTLKFPDNVIQATATIGQGAVTLGAAVAGSRTLAQAGIANGSTLHYALREGDNQETGLGTFNSGTGTFSRDTVYSSTLGGTTKLTLAGAAIIWFDAAGAWLEAVRDALALVEGAATFLADPSSANLLDLLTDGTGSGPAVFANGSTQTLVATEGMFGTELATAWTNNGSYPYETFTSPTAATISSAINTGSYGMASTRAAFTAGHLYRITFNLTLNSGITPYVSSCTSDDTGGAAFIWKTVAGLNIIDFVSDRTNNDFVLLWMNEGDVSNYSVSNFSIKENTAPSLTDYGPAKFVGQASFLGGLTTSGSGTSEEIGHLSYTGKPQNAILGYKVRTLKAKNALVGYKASSLSDEAIVIGYLANATVSPYSAESYGGQPVIIGSQATGNGVALGYKAQATNYEAIAIGPQTQANALATVAIGDSARALSSGGAGNIIIIGDVTWATGNIVTIIGGGCGSAHDFVAAFGAAGGSTGYNLDVATANHQGFLGWYQHDATSFSGGAGYLNDWWIGGPVTASAPHAITLNITSGLGANVAGVDVTINASRGTGNAAPGAINFQTVAAVGGSGSTLQTLALALKLHLGNVVCGAGAIATNATDGFLNIPSCAGPPTGTPTAYTGRIPLVYDSTNDVLYLYRSGWKKAVANVGTCAITWQ